MVSQLWILHLGVDALYDRFLVDVIIGGALPMVLLALVLSRWLSEPVATAVAIDVVAIGLAILHEFGLVVFPMPVRPLTILAGVFLLGGPAVATVTARLLSRRAWSASLRAGLVGWIVAAAPLVVLIRAGVPIGHWIADAPSLGLLPGVGGLVGLSVLLGAVGGVATGFDWRLPVG